MYIHTHTLNTHTHTHTLKIYGTEVDASDRLEVGGLQAGGLAQCQRALCMLSDAFGPAIPSPLTDVETQPETGCIANATIITSHNRCATLPVEQVAASHLYL